MQAAGSQRQGAGRGAGDPSADHQAVRDPVLAALYKLRYAEHAYTPPRRRLTAWPRENHPEVPRGRRRQRRHELCLRDGGSGSGPAVLTVPPTSVMYSVQMVDVCGNIIPVNIPPAPGTYALIPPGWKGKLPPGLTRVTDPYLIAVLNIRADKFSYNVKDIPRGECIPPNVRMTTLAKYEADHNCCAARLLFSHPGHSPSASRRRKSSRGHAHPDGVPALYPAGCG